MKKGRCYEAAGRLLMDPSRALKFGVRYGELTLVHAEVQGQGMISGVRHGHAWVVAGDVVVDVSGDREIVVPREFYYRMGRVDEIGNICTYTRLEACEKMLEHGHWGPWDLETSTGL